ncbi:hypothetical protein [Paenibacillus sp. OSY-SE]|uniref:hypothetical protein n=1 Tax=Paenibacillus sp. OSY-SE TaxID=1196323 RepID=UPI00178C46DE|nr:hypothetical protein [Paenibacillus sp. OSY-SE]
MKAIDPMFQRSLFYTVIGDDGFTIGEVYVLERGLLPKQSKKEGRRIDTVHGLRRAGSPGTSPSNSDGRIHTDV